MRLEIDVEIEGTLTHGDAALMMVEVASDVGQTVLTSNLEGGGAEVVRLADTPMVWIAPQGQDLSLRYRASVKIARPQMPLVALKACTQQSLPGEVVPYLRPSRYCQSDLFTDFTQAQFGSLSGGAKVQAIRDWVAGHVAYTPGSSHGGTTAVETFAALEGVCRDFAHLVCTLSRAGGIPARYASAYGIDVTPQDFHAVTQVWLDGAWHLVDATGMGAPNDLAVIAVGRDAADVAFMETARAAELTRQQVRVVEA